MELVVPAIQHLESYTDALRRGWSPDNIRLEAAAREELARITYDPVGFILAMDNRNAKGGPVVLPDGSEVPRLPGYRRWMWDGTFAGSIGFRWQPGTEALPAHCLGHIGYSVVPWRRGRGYATQALALILQEVRREGLRWVELTTDPDNQISQKVILKNGGHFIERFRAEAYDKDELKFRIPLTG